MHSSRRVVFDSLTVYCNGLYSSGIYTNAMTTDNGRSSCDNETPLFESRLARDARDSCIVYAIATACSGSRINNARMTHVAR